jgi:hypothetical protein
MHWLISANELRSNMLPRGKEHDHSNSNLPKFERTLSMVSRVDSSGDIARRRTARKAASRTVSEAVDHNSKHFWMYHISEIHSRLSGYQTHLEVCLDRFSTANNVGNKFGTLSKGKAECFLFGQLGEKMDNVVEMG